MRKIDQLTVDAVRCLKPFSLSNTTVSRIEGGMAVFLYGHEILRRMDNGKMQINLQGWPTDTTRNRLTAVLKELTGGYVAQRKGYQVLKAWVGGEEQQIPVDGWVTVL